MESKVKWISVKDSLPGYELPVLVLNYNSYRKEHDTMMAHRFKYANYDGSPSWTCLSDSSIELYDVTHWAELPYVNVIERGAE